MAFKPGVSGNPSGARKKSPEQVEFEAKVREWCRLFAFDRLRDKANSRNEKIAAWAIDAMLNRAFGKSVETAVIDAHVTSETGSSVEALAGELAAIIGEPAPQVIGSDSPAKVDAGA